MASITYWNRLEPRPRTGSLTRALAAQVRDPMWMLTRQWQLGEYRGEDAASPAFVTTHAETAPVLAWRAAATAAPGAPHPFDPLAAPLEPLVEQEPVTPDLALRVELGQAFGALLDDAGLGAHLGAYRTEYRIARPSEAELAGMLDQDHARFLRVTAERSVDGVRLYDDIVRFAPALPPTPAVPAAVLPVLQAFRAWVEASGVPGAGHPEAWRPERLEYGVEVVATVPGRGNATLAAHPGRAGGFDWYSFDLGGNAPAGAPAPAPVASTTSSILPGPVRFKGMPNKRWWHFEAGGTDLGEVQVDKRDVAKLVVIDFMLVHGNDWYVIPFEMETGTSCRVTGLTVHDVFGGVTTVGRADAGAGARPGTERWSMFSTSRAGSDELADVFLLPPSAGELALDGEPLEQVRFLRDEMANMAWALEHTVENGVGEPWRAHERDQLRRARAAPPHAPTPPDAPPLGYRIQSDVPEHWIPFLPVAIDAARRQIALEQGAMLRYPPSPAPPEAILPVGRILNPGVTPYVIREEEVPREGVQVDRVMRRARWIDGSAYLWCARRVAIGRGEGQSGLRFDQALVRPPPPPSPR
jgi:hypothetical protein